MGYLPFEGQTIKLRDIESEDAEAIWQYLTHPELTGRRYAPGRLDDIMPLSLKAVEEAVQSLKDRKKSMNLAVIKKATHDLVGHVSFDYGWDPYSPWLSVVIAPEHQRNGFGREAAVLILKYIFNHTPAHVVIGGYSDWNEEAAAFAQALGYTQSGKSRRNSIWQGRYVDYIGVDILRRGWFAKAERG